MKKNKKPMKKMMHSENEMGGIMKKMPMPKMPKKPMKKRGK